MKKLYNPKTGKIVKAETIAPTERITVINARVEPDSMIEWADVDRVSMAIRSARGGATQLLFALYRDIVLTDSHIQTEMAKRKMAVLCDQFRIIPYDKKNEEDIAAAAFCEQQIYQLKAWRNGMSALLDGFLWPVSVVEKVFETDGKGFRIADLIPVPQYLYDFSKGILRIRLTREDGTPGDETIEPDPVRYIVHRGHMLNTPDQFGGPMRSLVWWWLASTMNRDWWVRFLERYGTPFVVGKYAPGNDGDRAILLAAMSQATRAFGLTISKNTEIELVEASKTAADAFSAFMAVAQREKSKLILGQTLSTQTDPTGLGSGASDFQAEVRDDIRKLDGMMLSETIRDQLLIQLCAINGRKGRAPYVMWGKASIQDVQATANALVAIRQAGFEPDDDAMEPISDEIGFTIRRAAAPPPMPVMPFTAATEVGAHPFRRRK